MKLGPTVGTRTWGGFMAVGGVSAIDGGFISTPVEGSFTPEGKWLPDGYGFNPEHVVDEDPNAFIDGRDPQMDKAIELLKEEIRRDPPHWPKRLAPPSKEGVRPEPEVMIRGCDMCERLQSLFDAKTRKGENAKGNRSLIRKPGSRKGGIREKIFLRDSWIPNKMPSLSRFRPFAFSRQGDLHHFSPSAF